jgi:hypothetical protein
LVQRAKFEAEEKRRAMAHKATIEKELSAQQEAQKMIEAEIKAKQKASQGTSSQSLLI